MKVKSKKHFQPISERPEIDQKSPKPKLPKRGFMILMVGIIFLSMLETERIEKLRQNLNKLWLEHFHPVCEQYALKAVISGNYPCYECPTGKIYLNIGEVWRYGTTGINGQSGRYPNNVFYKDDSWLLNRNHLFYVPEFTGTSFECLEQEQIKIFTYPTLPEALIRAIKLIRPPGNKQDR